MEQEVQKSTGQKTPYSHIQGSKSITGTLGTLGILCTNNSVSPPIGVVGDHRFQVHDFCSESMMGMSYPNAIKPSDRALYCIVEKTVKKDNTVLKELII